MWDKHTHYHCAHSHGGGDGEGAGVFFLVVLGAVIAFVAWIHHQRHAIAKAASETMSAFVDAIVWALEMVALCVAVGVGSIVAVLIAWRVSVWVWRRHGVKTAVKTAAQFEVASPRFATLQAPQAHTQPVRAIEAPRPMFPVIDAEIVDEPHVIKGRAR